MCTIKYQSSHTFSLDSATSGERKKDKSKSRCDFASDITRNQELSRENEKNIKSEIPAVTSSPSAAREATNHQVLPLELRFCHVVLT